MQKNLKHIHTSITFQYFSSRKYSKVTNTIPHDIHSSEQSLPPHMHTKLAQLRTNKAPLLCSYLHKINSNVYTPQCLLCLKHAHNTNYLFNCNLIPMQHHTSSLWTNPHKAAEHIQEWQSRLAKLEE